ncbi:hypothetical protein TorRG33x02_333700 [Trema orientale]|uniref:Hydroxyproline-rich glycoprotein family protein n=1 Tax=Trema orientale TaxID=63057 RepID=A0A2P5B3Y6_TREOI|nr:hypothetical protein TorRG33x02_333700 [Trema orientale]
MSGLSSLTFFASLSLLALAIVSLSLLPVAFSKHHYISPLLTPTTPYTSPSATSNSLQLDRLSRRPSPPPPPRRGPNLSPRVKPIPSRPPPPPPPPAP